MKFSLFAVVLLAASLTLGAKQASFDANPVVSIPKMKE